jgi:class 3 adenylate cyclase
MTKIVTIVELDLVGYSDKARMLQNILSSAEAVARLDSQIQAIVDDGLRAVALPREGAVLKTAGDSTILGFAHPAEAHRFARAVHEAARRHNLGKTGPLAEFWFRIGAATGEIHFTAEGGQTEPAGLAITDAKRLETAARPGGFLVDLATFNGLPLELQHQYGPDETIRGKRNEQFRARQCLMLPGPQEDGGQPSAPSKPRPRPPQARRRKAGAQSIRTGSGGVAVGNNNVVAGKGGIAIGRDHHGDITRP